MQKCHDALWSALGLSASSLNRQGRGRQAAQKQPLPSSLVHSPEDACIFDDILSSDGFVGEHALVGEHVLVSEHVPEVQSSNVILAYLDAHDCELGTLSACANEISAQDTALAKTEDALRILVQKLESTRADLEIVHLHFRQLSHAHDRYSLTANHIDQFVNDMSIPEGIEDCLIRVSSSDGLTTSLDQSTHALPADATASFMPSQAVSFVGKRLKTCEHENIKTSKHYKDLQTRLLHLSQLSLERSVGEVRLAFARMQTPGTNVRIVRDAVLVKNCGEYLHFLRDHGRDNLPSLLAEYMQIMHEFHRNELSVFVSGLFDRMVGFRPRSVPDSDALRQALSTRMGSYDDAAAGAAYVELAVILVGQQPRPLYFEEVFRNIAQKIIEIAREETKYLEVIFGNACRSEDALNGFTDGVSSEAAQQVTVAATSCGDSTALALTVAISESMRRKSCGSGSLLERSTIGFHMRTVDEVVRPQLDELLDQACSSLHGYVVETVQPWTILGWSRRYCRTSISLGWVLAARAAAESADDGWVRSVLRRLQCLRTEFIEMLERASRLVQMGEEGVMGPGRGFMLGNLDFVVEFMSGMGLEGPEDGALCADMGVLRTVRDEQLGLFVDWVVQCELGWIMCALEPAGDADDGDDGVASTGGLEESYVIRFGQEWEGSLERMFERVVCILGLGDGAAGSGDRFCENKGEGGGDKKRSCDWEWWWEGGGIGTKEEEGRIRDCGGLVLRCVGSVCGRVLAIHRNVEKSVLRWHPEHRGLLVPHKAIAHWLRALKQKRVEWMGH